MEAVRRPSACSRFELPLWALSAVVLFAFECLACAGQQSPVVAPPIAARSTVTGDVAVRISHLQVTYLLEPDGRFTRTMRRRYQVLRAEAVEGWGYSAASWQPWHMAKPTIEATVTDAQGTKHVLDPATLSETSADAAAPNQYGERRELRGPLPGMGVGAIVEETIVERSERPFFSGGMLHHLTLQFDVPVDSVELSVDAPEALELSHVVRDADVKIEEHIAAGRRRLTFRGGPYAAVEPLEPFAPDDIAPWPYAVFAIKNDWATLAQQYAARVDERRSRGTLPGVDVARIIQGAQTDEEKANRLLEWLQGRIRYVALQFGQGTIIPTPPAETLKRGYGDCKDQSLLLLELLDAAGIEAHLALLRAGPGEDVAPEVPALNTFDHAIVVVPGETPLWIDATASGMAAGQLPLQDQGRQALIATESTRELVTTPRAGHEDNTYLEVREVHLAELGRGYVLEKSTAAGLIEQHLRSQFAGSRDEILKHLTNYAKETYGASSLGRFELNHLEGSSERFAILLEARDATTAVTNLFDASVALQHNVLFQWIPSEAFADRPRRMDFVLPMAHSIELQHLVYPPKGFVVGKLPEVPPLDLGPVQLLRSFEPRADGTIAMRSKVIAAKRRWSPSELEAFRKGVKKYQAEPLDVIELQHVAEQHVAARRFKEGVAALQAELQREPDKGLYHMRVAFQLADLGFGSSAREEARRAVQLDPENASLWASLGSVLLRDDFGRELRAGYDRAGALAAFAEAARLDPSDTSSKLQIAVVREHDERGHRYQDAKELAAAVAAYDAIDAEELRAFDDGSYAANPIFCLLYAGRFAEARERLALTPARSVPAVIPVLVAATSQGALAAITEADRLGRGDERNRALAVAADSLVAMRRYTEAATLLSAAAAGSDDPLMSTSRATLLSTTRPIDVSKLAEKTPVDVLRKATLIHAALDEDAARDAERFIARAARRPDSAIRGFFAGIRSGTAAVGQGPDVAADLMVVQMRFDTDGDARVEQRVDMKIDGLKGSVDMSFFLLMEDGQPRLRAIGHSPGDLGHQAFTFVQQNQLARARQWLKWSAELMSSPGGSDPLRVPPWLRLWDNGKGDVAAAAAVLCGVPCADAGISELLRLRGTASSEAQQVLDHALVLVYFAGKQPAKALEPAERLLARHPSSQIAQDMKRSALWMLRRYDDLIAFENSKLAGARDGELMRVYSGLSAAQRARGNAKLARTMALKIIEQGRAPHRVYNNLAWYSVFDGQASEVDVTHALRAAQLSQFKDAYSLHTLASVYAELGKVDEARQTLLRLLELAPNEKPSAATWFVVGRVAEQLGLDAIAKQAYGKTINGQEPDAEEDPSSVYALAKKRIAKLH